MCTVQGYEGIHSGADTLSLGSRDRSGSSDTLPFALTSNKDSQLRTEESSRTVSASPNTLNKKLIYGS
jgi:hypothetical protein